VKRTDIVTRWRRFAGRRDGQQAYRRHELEALGMRQELEAIRDRRLGETVKRNPAAMADR
jgi:hypothetical protein